MLALIPMILFTAIYCWGLIDMIMWEAQYRGDAEILKIVTMEQILANPKGYNGKQVAVTGVCNIEFEWNAIFASYEDWKDHTNRPLQFPVRDLRISLNIPSSMPVQRLKYHGKNVLVVGTLKTQPSPFPSYLVDITRFELYPKWKDVGYYVCSGLLIVGAWGGFTALGIRRYNPQRGHCDRLSGFMTY